MSSPKKQALIRYIEAVAKGDADGIRSVVTEDYTHHFLGTTVLAGTRSLSDILAQLEAFTSALVKPAEFTFDLIVEEGDVVSAMFSGKCELVNGNRFDGDYAVFCRFRGDKILAMHELIDTKLADAVLV